jgi:hypothetical protein
MAGFLTEPFTRSLDRKQVGYGRGYFQKTMD